MKVSGKQLIVFDLDGTLAESKLPMDSEMSNLLLQLLRYKKVAVMSGGSYKQFQNQFLKSLQCSTEMLSSLYLFPTCATSFYQYKDDWVNIYKEKLTETEKQKIIDALSKALRDAGFVAPKRAYGNLIEDRTTLIAFSALGQQAPVTLKKVWDPDRKKRLHILMFLKNYIPEFEIRIGGTTTIDITRKGIDKAYGIYKMEKHLNIPKSKMLFVGDALFEGGNDYPVKACGVDCIAVEGPEETKKIIKDILQQP